MFREGFLLGRKRSVVALTLDFPCEWELVPRKLEERLGFTVDVSALGGCHPNRPTVFRCALLLS